MRTIPLVDGVDFTALPSGRADSPLHVSQHIVDSDPRLREPLLEAVRARIRELSTAATITPALKRLSEIPSGVIVSLNYDQLVERAAQEGGRAAESLDLAQAIKLIAAGGDEDGTLRVIHLHGDVEDDANPLVLEEHAYQALLSDRRVATLFSALVFKMRLVAVGTSLQEPHVLDALRLLRTVPPRHVLVCEQRFADQVRTGNPVSSISPSEGLGVCGYPDGQHYVLERFLEELVSRQSALPRTSSLMRDGLYIDRTFLRTDHIEDAHIEFLLGRAEVLDEEALSLRPRAIVIGMAGSGKSHLLHRLRTDSGSSEHVVLVRLRRIVETFGSAQHLLEEWLQVAEATAQITWQGIVDGTQPVHLLLDGLDELLPRRREAAVDAIKRLGDELAHVRITVTSRPAAALSAFGEGWQHFELLCDAVWQDKFLEAVDTDLASIQARLGASAMPLQPLLGIPFYLRRLATASSDTIDRALADGDVCEVILALLDDLLGNDETLRALAPGVRRWLTRCALLMQLTDTRQLELATLTALAADLNLGDVEELAQRLSARSLLQDSAQTWTFEHRIFADALVAGDIVGDDPVEWLDTIAPIVHGRSAVREDWKEVVKLLGGRSASWRAAVHSRDSAAAARITPADAPVAERVAAMWTLWDHSTRRQVWLEGGFNAFDDGEHIARIAPEPAPEEFIAEVEQRLTDGNRYDRANAMDVLVRLQRDLAAERLRAALENEPDSTVRRNAASWARRLELTELRELIIHRAKHFADEAEAADMASIALALTPRRERLELGRELVKAGNREVQDYNVVEGMSAMEHIRWLLEEARADPAEALHGGYRTLADLLPEVVDATEEDAADAAELAAHSDAGLQNSVVAWVADHPKGSAIGVVRALEQGGLREHFAYRLAMAVGSDALRNANAPVELVQQVEQAEQWRRQPPTELLPDEVPEAVRQREVSSVLSVRAALELDKDVAVAQLIRCESTYVRELKTDDPALHRDMRTFLDRLWEDQNLSDHVILTSSGAQIATWVLVVLAYGPAVDLPLSDGRWGQAAVCGWLFEPQIAWLRASASSERVRAAALKAPAEIRVITDLLRLGTPDTAGHVAARVGDLADAALEGLNLTRLLQELANARATTALRQVASRNSEIAAKAAPLLARAGDTAGQRASLEALHQELRSGGQPDRHDHVWLDSISDEELLDDVVATFILGNEYPQQSSPFDITRPLLAAIQRIGGARALDEIEDLAAGPRWDGAQWLFRAVDEMVQTEMNAAARLPAERMRASRGLPPIAST